MCNSDVSQFYAVCYIRFPRFSIPYPPFPLHVSSVNNFMTLNALEKWELEMVVESGRCCFWSWYHYGLGYDAEGRREFIDHLRLPGHILQSLLVEVGMGQPIMLLWFTPGGWFLSEPGSSDAEPLMRERNVHETSHGTVEMRNIVSIIVLGSRDNYPFLNL